jgi:hypothetical protein
MAESFAGMRKERGKWVRWKRRARAGVSDINKIRQLTGWPVIVPGKNQHRLEKSADILNNASWGAFASFGHSNLIQPGTIYAGRPHLSP